MIILPPASYFFLKASTLNHKHLPLIGVFSYIFSNLFLSMIKFHFIFQLGVLGVRLFEGFFSLAVGRIFLYYLGVLFGYF